jgi:subtilisin family serine protease
MRILPRLGRRALVTIGVAAVVVGVAATGTATAMAAPTGEIRGASAPGAIAGSYVVVLKADAVGAVGSAVARDATPARASSLVGRYGGTVTTVYSAALTGFAARMSVAQAARLAADPAVAWVEQDRVVSLAATQQNATWGLDRIDQRNRPLSSTFTYPNSAGSGVTAYIIDTGILTSHSQFGGRASLGPTFAGGGSATDCNGHGTHVAGTVGGSTYGVAKSVRLVAVKVLSCSGSGSVSGVVSGINWVTQNAARPAVANMSLGGGASSSIDNAVTNSINSRITYAVAAGNSSANACNSSPARTPAALTVGSSTSGDARSSFSNFGSCVDIFAPGSSITSAWIGGNSATRTISGTSMASPHVAGAAALVLGANPSWTASQVGNSLNSNATTNVLSNVGSGSPNRLLFVVN